MNKDNPSLTAVPCHCKQCECRDKAPLGDPICTPCQTTKHREGNYRAMIGRGNLPANPR